MAKKTKEEQMEQEAVRGGDNQEAEASVEMVSATANCKFCGQGRIVSVPKDATPEEIEEAATLACGCEAAKGYAESVARVGKAKKRVVELFGPCADRPVDNSVVDIMLSVVDAIEKKSMKGISVDVGQGVKAKVSKMAKESIKVERTETVKKIYEE